MKTPLQVTFHNLEPSQQAAQCVSERAAALEKYAGELMGCRVVIDVPHRHHRHGKLVRVRIDLTVPGGEIVVNRDPSADHSHENLLVAINDAFDAARRRLEDFVRRRRGDVKHHESVHTAIVEKLCPDDDYGFLVTPEERSVYFHRHAVLDDGFDRLQVGSHVTFVEEEGEKGPQARQVTLV